MAKAPTRVEFCVLGCETTRRVARAFSRDRPVQQPLGPPPRTPAVPAPISAAPRQDFLAAEVASDTIPAGFYDDGGGSGPAGWVPGIGRVEIYQQRAPLEDVEMWQIRGATRGTYEVRNFGCELVAGDLVWMHRDFVKGSWIVQEMRPLTAWVGQLQATAPAGSQAGDPIDCAGGPVGVALEILDADGCYSPMLKPDGTQKIIQVFNMCAEIEVTQPTRVQGKRVGCTHLIDVECCPAQGDPGPVGGIPMSRLGPWGGPMGRRVSPY